MPASLGVHGPGETTTRSKPPLEQLVDRGAVVAHDLELAPQLAQVLDEVVGERVVVVDDEDLHGQSGCSIAISTARRTPRALASDSRELVVGLGVGDGAAAGLDVGDAVLEHHRADVDAGVEVAGVAQVADRAAVAAALDRLELVDDLHRADLRRAARACRPGSTERSASIGADLLAQRRRTRDETMCITCE